MYYEAKQSRRKVDWALILSIIGVILIARYGLPLIEYICTNNILKGEF